MEGEVSNRHRRREWAVYGKREGSDGWERRRQTAGL